jgi:N-acetylneuraminic acid mutarotase
MNDVWKSSDGITWTQVTAHAQFAPRYQHSAYVLNGKLWVLGGRNATGGVPGTYVGDAWSTTDGATWTKENVNVLSAGFLMPAVQESGKATIFGGLQAAFTNNVWQSTDGANWSELTTNAQFTPRHTSGTEFNGQMWIIGGGIVPGSPGTSVTNEIWRSSDGLNWTRVVPNGAVFSARDRHAVVSFNNQLWVIGGWDELPSLGGTGTRFNDVWSSPDGVNWTQHTPAGGTIFSPRLGHSALVYGGKLWVIGGDIDGGTPTETVVNDVWSTTDGTTWVKVNGNPAFPAREGHGAAVFNDAMWIVGGDDANGARTDVWKSTDGINWSQQSPAGTVPRTHHGTAVLNGRLYIVGGADGPYYGATQYNDVWSTADGITWRQDTAAAPFPARGLLATFVHNNELWFTGGLAAGLFNDVWRSSDGVTWRVGFSHPIAVP